MCKRLLLLAIVLLIAGAPSAFAAVGVFDFSKDIGNPGGTGGTRYVATDQYLILGGGSDIWGNADQFHYAYNEVSGNIRIEMAPSWDIGGGNDWAKIEAMLRVDTSPGSVHYSAGTRRGGNHDPYNSEVGDWAGSQYRPVADGGSAGVDWWGRVPQKVAEQRVVSNGYQLVQTLGDFGSGWEAIQTQLVPGLPDQLLAGVAVTSHDNYWLTQARVGEVAYTQNPDLVGVPQVGDPLAEPCGDLPGFLVSAAKMPEGWDWWDEDGANGTERWEQFKQAEYLVKNNGFTGYFEGDPTEYMSAQYGKRVVELVNLYDTGGHNAFDDATEQSFPGIDAFVAEPEDPADGDDDDRFGVLVEGCIELTEGIHILGGAFDDGVLIRIGGVEIGRTNSWDETGLWVFEATTAGVYSLEAVGFEGGGGAGLELYEWLQDGTMVLMGDVANGASPVYVPEPATIALLGFGGLSMLRIRKKR